MAQARHTMKKIFLGLLLFLSLTGASFAQSSMMATLSHEGEISVFYGPFAFRDAHAAAKHGDAIALSGGTFKGCDITKAITLRGAGWERDTIRNTIPTKIENVITISIGDTVPQRLTVEGIYYEGKVQIKKGLNNATFIKTRFHDGVTYSGDVYGSCYKNNSFIQCLFYRAFYGTEYHKTESSYNFINCYFWYGINNYEIYSTFTNCAILSGQDINSIEYSTLNNCILQGVGSSSGDKLPASSFATNCVVYNSYYGLGTFTNASPTNKVSSAEELWVGNGILRALTDEAKAKFLGDDGTEVGIYGGPFPFTSTTTNPQITKCNVASRSTADGKLSIDIEVKAGE